MKVIYFTKYSRNGASSRLRSFQYFPLLEAEGIEVTVRPLFDEGYLNRLYSGGKTSKFRLLQLYLSRFFTLFTLYRYDRVVIEKELFPYFFSWFEKVLFFLGVDYIVDYDDAIFHNYDLNSNKLIVKLMKNKIDNVMRYSSCVIAGNSYLAKRAKRSGARKIVLLPTVIDIERYEVKAKPVNSPVVIGWIGSPSTFKYIQQFEPVFLKLSRKYEVELHIVGVKEESNCHKNIKYIEWSEKEEVKLIANFDIGLMPLQDSPWELGKCAYKLIQYMGCGVPVVASAIGMNNEVVQKGRNGFLVKKDSAWVKKLGQLITDHELRAVMGKNGRVTVERKYCLQHNFPVLAAVIRGNEATRASFETWNGTVALE